MMSSSETRQNAISAAISWSGDTHANGKKLERVDEFYGADVFSISAMRQRLPKNIFKKLLRPLEWGEETFWLLHCFSPDFNRKS